MKIRAWLPLAVAVLSLGLLPARAQAQTWTLAWSDEFNGAAGSAPSSSIWSFMQGNPGVNGELETYCTPTNNTSPCSTATPNIYEDGNGNLVISAIHTASGTWTSGKLENKTSMPKYGRIEARMKLTVGDGLWPAFWMLGSDLLTGTAWPTCGEIDILEWVPQDTPEQTTGTIHGPGYDGCCGTSNAHYTFPSGGRVDDANYHTYGIVWAQNSVQFYRDDPTNVFFTVTSANIPSGDTWVFNQPFYIILNEAVGGSYPTPGPDSTTPNPANVLVDYVRVYTASSCTAPTVPSALAATAASATQINLSWGASSSSCSVTYNVFRSTTSGFTPSSSNQIASGVTTTSYSDNGLAASTTYYYVVEATNGGGTSAASNQASATTNGSTGSCTSICIDSGSTTAVSPFLADEDFSGGATIDHANTINTSKVTNPAPAAVYQTGRDENFTYTIPGFTAESSHTVRLHFCETYFSTAGSRTFNVSINGTQVLTDFDIEKTAGGQNIANIQQFTENANSSGQYVIQFTSVVNNSLVSGIEID